MRRLPGGEINRRRRRRRVLLRGDHVPREIVVLCRQPIKIRLVSSVSSVSLFFVLLLLVSVAFPFRRRRWLWSNHAIPRARARGSSSECLRVQLGVEVTPSSAVWQYTNVHEEEFEEAKKKEK